MNSTRTIPGRPTRSGTEVAEAIIDLVASTLDASPDLSSGSVRAELAEAVPTLALLSSAGDLAEDALVLIAANLRLVINVPVGEAALSARDDTAPPRGATTATDWKLHIPAPGSLAALARSVASTCRHVSTEPPPGASTPQAAGRAAATGIDLSRLLEGNGRA